MQKPLRILGCMFIAIALSGVAGSAADAAVKPKKYSSCKALNAVYPHGVGKPGAKDKVAAGAKPVTTFTKNAKVYELNRPARDRDKDGIACEKL
jgi:Excalibur calcium-binding domain